MYAQAGVRLAPTDAICSWPKAIRDGMGGRIPGTVGGGVVDECGNSFGSNAGCLASC